MKAEPVPSELVKEGRPSSAGEKIAMILIVAIIVYLFIAG